MVNKPQESASPSKVLRLEAQERLDAQGASEPTSGDSESQENLFLLHELQVHKIELELQNEELVAARNIAEAAATSYIDLYDFAPIGYVTLDRAGHISRCNLNAARLLDSDRKTIVGKQFKAFVAAEFLSEFCDALSSCNKGACDLSCEIMLRGDDARTLQVEINDNNHELEFRLVLTDITKQKNMEKELREQQFWLTESQRVGCIGSYLLNRGNQTWLPSTVLDGIFGLEGSGVKPTQRWLDLVLEEDREALKQLLFSEVSSGSNAFYHEYRIIRPVDGVTRWVAQRGEFSLSENGMRETIVGTIQDITERYDAQVKLKLAASVFMHTHEGIMITDADGIIVEVNDTFSKITGYSREEAIGQSPRMLKSGQHSPAFYGEMYKALSDTGCWYGEMCNRRKNGDIYPEMLGITAVLDAGGNTLNYVSLFSDISDQKVHEQQLEHAANFDALTNLPNRALLADRLAIELLQCQRHGKMLAVVYLDLDGFKSINDIYGHAVGDKLLVSLATRMTNALRENDTLSRIGGDEFVAVLGDLDSPDDCKPVLDRLLESAAKAIYVERVLLKVSASLGVAIYPQSGTNADLLLRQADQAMYVAKDSGKNRYHFYDINSAAEAKILSENLAQVRKALVQNEFCLFYQPKINMKTSKVVGVEALIRWYHPDRGLLEPDAFLPFVENNAIRLDLGKWVIANALDQISEWNAEGLNIPVSVNVGAYQLHDKNFLSQLKAGLADHPSVRQGQLELEILETSALEDVVQISQLISDCDALGVSFALDDFGTGYSSLTYLKRLPVSALKIDLSFVRDMLENSDDLAIVKGIIRLVETFNRNAIAEGVETEAHGKMLLSMKCEVGQGYGIARPMPAAAISKWIRDWNAHPVWIA